jgi:serine/threonine protein kinase
MLEQIGRYQITKELGRGAMGVIYAATDPLIGRPVAIKTIRLGSLDSGNNRDELTKRLYREAQSAGILSHPGIVTIHDIGEQGEDAYIVMEYVVGRPLEELLNPNSPQHSDKLISLLRQTAVALDYAHSKGIIHRDVKPSNIMICEDGSVKVADFGIAKLSASASMTQSGFVLGTPSYMSPEQAQGLTVDGRSDQFSLAVVAYQILTGSLPFVASTLTALLAKILWEEPDYDRAGLKQPLLGVFRKSLSKDPKNRFASCTEFVQEIECAFGKQKAGSAQNIPESPDGLKETQPAVEVIPRRKKAPIALLASISAVVLIVVAFFAVKSLRKPEIPVPLPPPAAVKETNAIDSATQPESAQDPSPAPTTASSPVQPANAPKPKTQIDANGSGKAVPRPASFTQSAVSVQPPKPAPKRTQTAEPTSGTLIWTGELQKNSVLVIEDQHASIGTVAGQLPGKPLAVEVVPKEVVIRQLPDGTNGWKLIILYSGNQKFTSITINWKTTQ